MYKIAYIILIGFLIIPRDSYADADGFVDVQKTENYKIIKLQREISSLSKKRDRVTQALKEVEENYKDLSFDNISSVENNEEENKKIVKEDKNIETQNAETKAISDQILQPKPITKKYNQQKTKDNKNSGRRPFIRSDISSEGQAVYYAGIAGREDFGFADESNTDSSSGNYSGFNDSNVYVFPDSFAVYCELSANDAENSEKMIECINGIIKDKSVSNQKAKEHVIEVVNSGVFQEIKEGFSSGAKNKNIAGNFEKQVLDPLNKDASESTDERSDFETLTMTEMEAVKTKYRLIDVYSSLLKFQALKSLSDYEIKSEEFTDIDARSGTSK